MIEVIRKNPNHRSHIVFDYELTSFDLGGNTGTKTKTYKKGDFFVHLPGVCRYKGRCEQHILPYLQLSELYFEELQLRLVNKEALKELTIWEREQEERCNVREESLIK